VSGSQVPAVVLGLIRLANGLLALFAPGLMLRALDSSQVASAPATYVLRMFGIRTIFLGLDLLAGSPAHRREALERAPIIHATDALAALTAGLTRQLAPRAAATTVGISSVNLALALVARNSGEPVKRR
jgi:uncharacterized protein YjeT (DUF2065 family)